MKKFLVLIFSFVWLSMIIFVSPVYAERPNLKQPISYNLSCDNNEIKISFAMPDKSSLPKIRDINPSEGNFYFKIIYNRNNELKNHDVYQGDSNNFKWSSPLEPSYSRDGKTTNTYRFHFSIGMNEPRRDDVRYQLGDDIVVIPKKENPCSPTSQATTTEPTAQQPAVPAQPADPAQPAAAGEAGSGSTGTSSTPTTLTKDNACQDRRITGDYIKRCDDLIRECVSSYNSSSILLEDERNLTNCFISKRKTVLDEIAAAANAGENKTPYEQLKAVLKYDTWKLNNEIGAWCGTYGGDCESYAPNTCSQKLLDEKVTAPFIVGKFNKCIRDKYEPGWDRGSTGTSGGSSGSSTGARSNTQAAPAGATSSIPRITTPQANTSGRRIEILNAWCAAYLGANTAKGNDCVDKANDKCKQTDEADFTNCVKGVGGEMQRAGQPQGPTRKECKSDADCPAGNRCVGTGLMGPDGTGGDATLCIAGGSNTPQTSDITITPTVNGTQTLDPLPQNTKTVNIGVKVFNASDRSETPLNLNNIELVLIRTTDEKTALINPPTRITDLKTEAGITANTRAAQNYTPYVAAIPGWGKYELTAKVNGKTSQPVRFQVGGLGSGSGTAERPKAFACTVNVDSKTADSIKVSAHEVANTNLVGYNRVTWYLKEGAPDAIISDRYVVGTNEQFPPKPGQNTEFKNLKPNQRYTILAAAYPDNLQANRVFCNSSSGIDVITPAKIGYKKPTSVKVAQAQTDQQVLAATSDDSGPTSVSVAASCDGACQVVAQGAGEPFATQIYGTEIVDIPVANRANTDSVTVTVIPITDQEETVNAQTITIPLPGSFGEFTATTTPAPTTQGITLSKTPPETQLTSPELVNLIAQTNSPLEGEVAFINKNNPEQKYVVHAEDKDLKCVTDPSQVCIYPVYLNKDEGSLEAGNYSFQLAQDNNPISEASIDFEVLSENAGAAPSGSTGSKAAPGTEIPTKITISVDGSEEQVLFTRDQYNPEQGYYANVDFDLPNIGQYTLFYRIYYDFSEENPDGQPRIIERINPAAVGADGGVTCGEEYAKDLGGGRAQNVKDCSDNTQPVNGEIYCLDPSQHIVDEHCESGGEAAAGGETGQSNVGDSNDGATATTPEQGGARVCTEGEYVRKCIQGTHCQYEVYFCNQNDLEYKGPEEDCQYCPDTREECHNEDEELSPGCFQSYSACPDGSRTPNGGPWSPDTGEACTPE